ncbi:MAG TPA: hypothetical protein VKE73_09030 [Myxococcota bacterium]|nr:hypothetical protein [Myxococcota bacterium]
MPPEHAAGLDAPYRLTIAPRFQLGRGFLGRLDRNGGVERGGDSGYAPRNDWRALAAEELSALVAEGSGPDALLPATELGLLQIPERIRAAWWREAERNPRKQDFEPVFSALVQFLRFKRLPLPERVHLEVSVNAPDLASTRAAPGGARHGLAYRDPGTAGSAGARQAVGLLNLGDEATFVALLEFPPAALVARLLAAGESHARTLSPDRLVNRYFERFPHQSLLRVLLEPGEGLWLSPEGVVHDGWTRGKRDLDVVLSLRVEVGTGSETAGQGAGGAAGRTKSEANLGREAPGEGPPSV